MAKKRAKSKPTSHTPQSSFRLPAETKTQIQAISRKYLGTSQTKVVIRAVAEMFRREFPSPKRKSEESA